MKGNKKTNEPVSNESFNNEQLVRKEEVLRDFLYGPIKSSWYRNENSNIIKLVLNELGVKANYTYVLRFLYAAAEFIRRLVQGEDLKNICAKNADLKISLYVCVHMKTIT